MIILRRIPNRLLQSCNITCCVMKNAHSNSLISVPNIAVANSVTQCRSVRQQNVRPGDWRCDACGMHNFRDKSSCFGCNVRRADGRSATHESSMQPGDWRCFNCRVINFATRNRCRGCHGDRLAKLQQAYEARESQPKEEQSVLVPPPPPPNVRGGGRLRPGK